MVETEGNLPEKENKPYKWWKLVVCFQQYEIYKNNLTTYTLHHFLWSRNHSIVLLVILIDKLFQENKKNKCCNTQFKCSICD